jgi:hypothetical protein
MATGLSIEPFPTDIDRGYFAAYLSGFTDGEGCFQLRLHEKRRHGNRWRTPEVSFAIALRADDFPVLRLIHSFFGCGRLDYMNRQLIRDRGLQSKDTWRYSVSRTADLVNVIVPHFERYPLLAKKSRDFNIWRQGVALAHHVNQLPAGRQGKQGRVVKWTEERLAPFRALRDALKATREYNAPFA